MQEETKELATKEVQLPTDVSFDKGIIPKSLVEVIRLANVVHQSQLAPKGFDTPQKVCIGIMTNLELGRPVITGLQDLAIINGRCAIFGDAIVAMILASGKMDEGYPKSTETGTPYTDDWEFTYTVKRKGMPEETGRFAWVEAKRAGLDKIGPPSPWAKWTRRMMQWKARNFVLRDNFGDIIKGVKTAEELYDYVELEPQANGGYGVTDMGVPSDTLVEETVIGQELKDEGVEPGTIDIPAEPDPRFDAKLAQWDKLVEESGVPVANVEKYLDAGEFPKDEDTPPAFTNRDSYKVRFVDAGHHRVRGFLENVQKAFQAEDPDPEETESTLICEHCDFEAKSERGLKKHITQQHSESTPAQDAEEMVAEVKKDLDAISDLVDPEVVEPEIVEPDPEQAARDDAYFTAFEKKCGEHQKSFQDSDMGFDVGNEEYFKILNNHGVGTSFEVRERGDKQLAIEINNAMADTLAAI